MSERTIDAQCRHFCRCLPFGAQLIGKTRARFRLWAPSRTAVSLEIAGQTPREMAASGDGWFDIETDCQAGDLYQYRLEPDLAVPDPASRFQPDDVHGYSEIVCPGHYVWRHPEWVGLPWEKTVLYELHVGAFGGYRGVIKHLASLQALGITAVELMPLNDFPGPRNWGYDGVLPFAPDSAYGEPDDLKALIDAAHGLGMMVFLDVVYNHFGPDGNYLHAYAAPFFKTGTPTPWGPAIDFDKAEVRDFFFENALYWLHEYRFDGLRLDAVHAIDNDRWLRELSERVHASVEKGRHVHLVLENERNSSNLLVHHFSAQWSDDAHNTMHVLLTGETEHYYAAFAERPLHKLARVLGEGFVYQGESSPVHDGAPRGEPSASLPPTSFVFFLQNHDQVGNRAFGERLRDLTDDDTLRAATALMLLSPQIPMLFMGDEIGSRQPFYFFTSYTGQLADAVREGRRQEFAKFAAFDNPEKRVRIPDPNAADTFAMSRPFGDDSGNGDSEDAAQWRTFYRDALTIRHRYIVPGLHHGGKTLGAAVFPRVSSDKKADKKAENKANNKANLQAGNEDGGAIIARWMLADGQHLSIAVNLGSTDVPAVALTDKSIYSVPSSAAGSVAKGIIPARSCVVTLEAPAADVAHLRGESP